MADFRVKRSLLPQRLTINCIGLFSLEILHVLFCLYTSPRRSLTANPLPCAASNRIKIMMLLMNISVLLTIVFEYRLSPTELYAELGRFLLRFHIYCVARRILSN